MCITLFINIINRNTIKRTVPLMVFLISNFLLSVDGGAVGLVGGKDEHFGYLHVFGG